MDRATALTQLPETYAQALRLHDAGLSDDSIASRLDVPTQAMTLLLRLAEAKVAHLMATYERHYQNMTSQNARLKTAVVGDPSMFSTADLLCRFARSWCPCHRLPSRCVNTNRSKPSI